MPKFKKNTSPAMYKRSAFKMKGFSGFGNSPIEKEKPMSESYKQGVTGLTPADEFKRLGVGVSLPRIQLADWEEGQKEFEDAEYIIWNPTEDPLKQKQIEYRREKRSGGICPKCGMKGTHCKC